MPGFLFSYQKFRRLYEIPIVKEGNETAASNLRRLIGPFVLRRLKKDVMKELPEKVEKIVYSAFSGEQKKLYGASVLRLKEEVESGEEKFKILSGLTRLRQICCDPSLCYENYRGGSAKLDTCMDVIAGAVPAGHRILLFSQFSSMFPLMEKRLSESGIDSFTLTGSTPKEERNRLAARFNAGEAQVFLISLKAGDGTDLTGADFVILYDPWWNAAAENQGFGSGPPDWTEAPGDSRPPDFKGNGGGKYPAPAGVKERAGRPDCDNRNGISGRTEPGRDSQASGIDACWQKEAAARTAI